MHGGVGGPSQYVLVDLAGEETPVADARQRDVGDAVSRRAHDHHLDVPLRPGAQQARDVLRLPAGERASARCQAERLPARTASRYH
jgi:hypothetical protein